MKQISWRIWLAGALVLGAAALAVVAKPTLMLADARPKLSLEKMFPARFGDWRVDPYGTVIAPTPDVQVKLDTIYQEVLSRTYVNSDGYRIMLSVAYGGDQSDALKVHRPEICYAVQGFQVDYIRGGDLDVNGSKLPVRRVLAHRSMQAEPLTYWIVTGDAAVITPMQQKLVQIAYGLRGYVPDGMLVRVSSLDNSETNAYDMQRRFANDMAQAMNPTQRQRVFGRAQITSLSLHQLSQL